MSERDEVIEECARVVDADAARAENIWRAYVAQCVKDPKNIGGGSTSWHQIYEGAAERIRALKAKT